MNNSQINKIKSLSKLDNVSWIRNAESYDIAVFSSSTNPEDTIVIQSLYDVVDFKRTKKRPTSFEVDLKEDSFVVETFNDVYAGIKDVLLDY